MRPRPPDQEVKLHPLMRGRVYKVDGEEPWYSLGTVMWRSDTLSDSARDALGGRAVETGQYSGDFMPPQAKLRFTYVTALKEDGRHYFVYRHRSVLRFVPAFVQPPKYLFMSNRGVMSTQPVAGITEPTPFLLRLGRSRISAADQHKVMTDHPDQGRARLVVSPIALPVAVVDRAQMEAEVADVEAEFENRHGPDFQRWFEGAADVVRNKDGTPKVFYRGHRGTGGEDLRSRLVMDSFTDSSEIASIYSTVGGEVKEGASVIPVYIDVKNPLVIPHGWMTFYDFLHLMQFEDWGGPGMSFEDSVKVLVYLRKRSQASNSPFGIVPQKLKSFGGMPNFKYQVKKDEDEDELGDDDFPINLEGGIMSDDLLTFKREWEASDMETSDYQKRLAAMLAVDTFALVETPATVRALTKMGYDGVWHMDQFNAADAAKKALDKEIDKVEGIEEGEDEDFGFDEMAYPHGHMTLRPLKRSQVWPLLSPGPISEVPNRKSVAASTRFEWSGVALSWKKL